MDDLGFQFTHPAWLLLLLVAVPWVIWLTLNSDVHVSAWRKWTAFGLRLSIVLALILAVAGLQHLKPQEGMNVIFVLDRSDSVPAAQQDGARDYVNRVTQHKKKGDKAGVLIFGGDAGIERTVQEQIEVEKIQAVVDTDRTDIASAIRLASAAFPESGQKRVVLVSDGNENLGDAFSAVMAAKPLGVSVDVMALGAARGNDVSVQRLGLPSNVKKGTTFEAKIFAQSDKKELVTLRLFRDDQLLGEQDQFLEPGKNLFTFPQTLNDPGFYTYDVQVVARGDMVAQNNRAISFTSVKGDPRILLVSDIPAADSNLVEALRSSQLEVIATDISGFPETLPEMQSYDAIFISNIAAGDLSNSRMRLLESAVRDFGVGLVCIGGDQTYAAGAYRGTPLETTLPVDMELSSKKVLPNGALVLVMHGMEFMNGNQTARQIAIGVLDTLGPQDELGIVLWDGTDRWLFPLDKAGVNKRAMGRAIMGMNQGDLPNFQNVMSTGYEALRKSNANLKHMIVFSDGDPGAPTQQLMDNMRDNRVTVSTVLIAGHSGPETMQWIASQGDGQFYDVRSPSMLPQIFIKEAAVILKSAIFEEPFTPQVATGTELTRGIGASEIPQLLGYVATTPKARAETPLVSESGDPILAHWQYGLGRAVAFTSDAKAKWAHNWLNWGKYRQFWSQVAQWSLRRLENSDFTTEVAIENGMGQISVEAIDNDGNFRNFLNLRANVVSPNGESQPVRLEQTAPGRYEAKFPTREVGAYTINLMDIEQGQVRGMQTLGASVNFSPEFSASEANMTLLNRVAEAGDGEVLEPLNAVANPFLRDRKKTYQPRDLWEWLLKFAILLFPLDVGIRRIQLDHEEMQRAWAWLGVHVFFWRGKPRPLESDESLAALLDRRNEVRSGQTRPGTQPDPELFRPQKDIESPAVQPSEAVSTQAAQESTPPSETQEKEAPASMASRLLEAKRRANRKRQ